ncbi:MAG: hypothetical protein KGL39_26265 [Patescibacteria group bacterium]|nr:hypothetical protein [Patescibacteria group bacterium]
MAKRSVKEDPLASELASIDAGLVAAADISPEIVPPGAPGAPAPAAVAAVPRDLPVHVPFLADGKGYCQRHLDVALSHAEAQALRGILDGLIHAKAKLAKGSPVKNGPDAIRWLLQETQVLAAG